MSEERQPLTEYLNRSKTESTGAAKFAWASACLMAILAAVCFSLWNSARHELAGLRASLDEATTNLVSAQAQVETNNAGIADLKSKLADLQAEKEMSSHVSKGLEEDLRSQLESKDVTISKLQGRLTVNILDRILFDSGEAVLKSDGEAVLKKVAGVLAQHPELKIHVVGHTDNVPIRPSARSRFASNWELSTARALAAVRFLTETAGVDPHRVGAVGYGEFRPVADNATPEGRARNRRIAITILPDELAGADTTITTNAPMHTVIDAGAATNAPSAAPTSPPLD
jgi:chemotaxis protein MotB